MAEKRKTRTGSSNSSSNSSTGRTTKRERQNTTTRSIRGSYLEDEDEDVVMWGSGSGSGSGRRSRGSIRSMSSSSSSSMNPSSSRSISSGMNESSINKMFANLADEDDPCVASMEGISKLCEELGIDPLEDIRILVLLWKMGATKKPAQIDKDEWKNGCIKLQVDSIEKFKSILPSLDTGFLERTEFKELYKFCFQFNRQGTHKTLDKDIVIALLGMILKGHVADDRLNTFIEFLSQTKDESYSKITLDQWTSFLDFCYEVDDIADYDEDMSAWPVLIDEYVEYMTNKK